MMNTETFEDRSQRVTTQVLKSAQMLQAFMPGDSIVTAKVCCQLLSMAMTITNNAVFVPLGAVLDGPEEEVFDA